MSINREVELTCDGAPGDGPYDCPSRVFGKTAAVVRKQAREVGWLVARRLGRDFCPNHRATEWYPTGG